MGNLTIRRLDDRVLAALKRRGAERNTSMEEEARRILIESVDPGRSGYWQRMERRRASYDGKTFSNSAELVREGRAERTRRLARRT